MADTLVEFINATKTLAELQAGVTVLTNTAGQTAVVRDVVIEAATEAAFSLQVGGATVATLTGAGKLTGTEIVPPSGSMTLSTATKALLNGCFSCATGTLYSAKFATRFAPGGDFGASETTTTITTGLSTNANFAVFDAAGDFYYHSVSAQTLYRRAGGINGAETSYTIGYAPCWDGARYIYAINGSQQITKFDTQTETIVSTVTISPSISFDSSYGQTATIDGYVLARNNYSIGNQYLINPATGASVLISVSASGSAQRSHIQIGKRTNGEYVAAICNHAVPNVSWWNIGSSLAAPAVQASGTFSTSPPTYAGDFNRFHRSPDASKLFWLDYNALKYFDIDAMAMSPTATLTGITSTSYGLIPTLDAARAAIEFGTTRVRATGIRSA